MVSRVIFIFIVFTVDILAFNTGKFVQTEIFPKTVQCEANRIYQKGDVTCFCNNDGRWPHKNCSLVFNLHLKPTCKPGSYVQVDCNVCRCSDTGHIDSKFCTKHVCRIDPQDKMIFRRSYSRKRCELNHWYVISECRLCFCITKDNLLCAAQSNPKNIQLGNYNVSDCGPNWLSDINKLLSSVNPLRLGYKREKLIDNAATENVHSQPTPSYEAPREDPSLLVTNQENNGVEKVNIARNNDKSNNIQADSSAESESEVKADDDKPIARIAGNTAMPFENDEENDSNNSNELESDRKESDIESVGNKKESEDFDVTKEVESIVSVDKNKPEKVENEINEESDQSLIKLNLPGMLGRVFNFGLRKSLVSLDSTNCMPGSTFVVKCNTCFCLNNGKMLCTKKICK